MKDTFGREITYLRLSVTDLCNLRCRYCMGEDGVCKQSHADMLTEDEMILAVETAASLGVRKLRITGGEPLVKKNILSICRRAAAVEGIEELCMTTNGTLLPEFAVPLREAGVRRLNISIDSLNSERYAHMTRGGALECALRGLEAALAAGFAQVKVNVVLIGGFNDDEVASLAELSRTYPVDVRFIEMMPMYDGGDFAASAFVPGRTVLEKLPEAQEAGFDGVARLYRLPGAKGKIGLINPLSEHFCAACNRLRLTADGKLKPCLHSPAELSIKGLTREEMRRQFERAILEKPARHAVLSAVQRSEAGRTMNRIGG